MYRGFEDDVFLIPKEVMRSKRLTPGEKISLAVIFRLCEFDYGSPTRYSPEAVAKANSIPVRTFYRHLKRLEKLRFIRRDCILDAYAGCHTNWIQVRKLKVAR